MSQPFDPLVDQFSEPVDGAPSVSRAETLHRIVTTLPQTLQERDLEVGRRAIAAYAAGDKILAHELCELHSHPVHAWRRIQADHAPALGLTEEDQLFALNAERQRQRFAALSRGDKAEVKRLSLELGMPEPVEIADVLPDPAPIPTTQHTEGVSVLYVRRRGVVRRAADFVGARLPFGLDRLYSDLRAIADVRRPVVPNQWRPVSPVDVFTKAK